MKVRAVLDFQAEVYGNTWWIREGDVFDLPEGCEGWLNDHKVVAVGPRIERGVMGIGEKAVTVPQGTKRPAYGESGKASDSPDVGLKNATQPTKGRKRS